MRLLKSSLLTIVFLILVAGCSTGGSGGADDGNESADSVDADVAAEIEAKEEADGDGEIPSGFPPGLYVPDDAEIQATFESDLQISFSYTTTMEYEEIKEIYQDYLGDTNTFSEYSETLSEDPEIDYFAAHLYAEFEDDHMDIEIKKDDEEEGLHLVIVTLYDNEELEEMFGD